jgi:hypothetical protein
MLSAYEIIDDEVVRFCKTRGIYEKCERIISLKNEREVIWDADWWQHYD